MADRGSRPHESHRRDDAGLSYTPKGHEPAIRTAQSPGLLKAGALWICVGVQRADVGTRTVRPAVRERPCGR